MIDSLQELLRQYGKYSSLIDLDFFFKEYYRLCAQYSFFNFDILEIKRNFPSSYDALLPLFNKVKLQLERRFDLLLQQKLLQKEANIKNIAANTWLFMFFMPEEGQLNGKSIISENNYRRRLWDYVLLYLTAKGTTEYSVSVERKFTGR